ncbi:Hemolysin-type calcium-binding repeat-containing protein [Azotobacter beijerinckii]|uniref:Hemolysin-type calcium-binding repeat-containing protein n=2 Tax=Azotobacter beijerinckii TaxID=170623 RepID=A0A1H9RQW8_9GAMM|nr:DUF4214 domain-containing protein [Azotobacter beijerinckii]SEJ48001.1 Hemolysin-type calcium-binding repeat-containing protein [Azotobacter beijerinckii]SER74309.1 Hemolysin-type calcium-binding repeat-containing protein [Azotobacter beijerinckii]
MAFNYDIPTSPQELLEILQGILEDNPGLPDLPEIPDLPDLIEIIGGSINVASGTVAEDGTLTTTNGQEGTTPDVLFVDVPGEAGQQQSIVVPNDIQGNTRLYTFSSDADLTMDLNTIERAVILGNGNDFVTVAGDHDTILSGGNGNDTLITSGGDDWVSGDRGNDSISTGAGNDTIVTGLGRDTIDAGEGFDVVEFGGDVENFRFFDIGHGDLLVHNKPSPANSAVISDAEFLQFNDNESIVVVGNPDEASAMRLYDALFDRDADAGGAQYWLDQVDNGTSLTDIANGFLSSAEFQDTNGSLDNAAFVDLLYQNALDRPADEAGKEFWVSALDSGATQAEVVIGIVGSDEAANAIDNVHIIPGNQV